MADVVKIPMQLRAIPLVVSTRAGVDLVTYSRSFLRLWHGAILDDMTPEIEAWINDYIPPTHPWELGDVEKIYPADMQPQLRRMAEALTPLLEQSYPLPAGEQRLSSRLTVTLGPASEVEPGTVVFIRQTNAATIQFLLIHIVMDLKTGQPRLVGLDGPPVEAEPETLPQDSMVMAAKASDVGADLLLTIGSNLVWALPAPWGPVGAAGLSVLQFLFPSGGSIAATMNHAVQRFEAFIQQQEINRNGARLKAFSDWLQLELVTMDKRQTVSTDYLLQLISTLRSNTEPGGENVYTAIFDLWNYIQRPGVFDIVMLGVSLYLLGLKMILQLEAQVAANNRNNNDDSGFTKYTALWLDDYANFETAIMGGTLQGTTVPGWAQKITDQINSVKTNRLNQITPVYRYNDKYKQCSLVGRGGGITCSWVDQWGWTWKDTASHDSNTTHFKADTHRGGDCCHTGRRVEYKDQAEAEQQQRVASVTGALDAQYKNAMSAVQKWSTSIQQWNQHMPPQRPATAPALDPHGWTGKPPQDPAWVAGNTVAYAVAFVNDSGPSSPGPYSESVAIHAEVGATLAQLPRDPLMMATKRWVYRQITTAAGDKVRIVGIVDMTTATFQDVAQ